MDLLRFVLSDPFTFLGAIALLTAIAGAACSFVGMLLHGLAKVIHGPWKKEGKG